MVKYFHIKFNSIVKKNVSFRKGCFHFFTRRMGSIYFSLNWYIIIKKKK